MTAVLVIVVAALWVGALVRLSTARSQQSAAFGRSVLALAIAGSVYLPPVSAAITAATLTGMASVLLYVAAAAAAIEMLQFMLWTTDPNAAQRMTMTKRCSALAGVGVVLAVSVLLGQPETANLAQPWTHTIWQYVFWMFWLSFVALTTGRMLAVCIRYVRQAGPSPLRTSQFLLAGAAASGLIYSLARLGCLLMSDNGLFELLAKLSVISLLGFLAAASVWALLVSLPTTRARTDWRALQQLRLLWLLLEPVNPATALHPLPLTRPPSSTQTRFALYRAVVEIRDWMYALSAYVEADTWNKCLVASANENTAHQVRVTATFNWLVAALEARENERQPAGATVCPPASEDIDSDIRLLCDVATQMSTFTQAHSLPQAVSP